MALSKTEGLLAFIWDIYTDDQKASAFKANPGSVMGDYRLTPDQQRVIWETALDRTNPANKDAWTALGRGSLPSPPTAGEPELEDSAWPNDGAMALLGGMIVDILGGAPQFDDAW